MITVDNEFMTSIISNFGFPIAITLYLLVRFEKRISNLEKKLSELITCGKSLKG